MSPLLAGSLARLARDAGRRLTAPPFVAGRNTIVIAVALAEVGCGDEPAREGDVDDGPGRLQEKLAGSGEPELEVVPRGDTVDVFLE